MVKAPQARAQLVRTIRMMRLIDLDGVGVFCITVGDTNTFYTVHELPCAIGGRGFAVHRTGLGSLYHVRIGEPERALRLLAGDVGAGTCFARATLAAAVGDDDRSLDELTAALEWRELWRKGLWVRKRSMKP